MDDRQRDLEDYNMDGTMLGKGITTHATSGTAATSQLGIWQWDSMLGDGKFGAVSRQFHAVTGTSRAVKMLKLGTQSNIRREIRMMIFLKNVGSTKQPSRMYMPDFRSECSTGGCLSTFMPGMSLILHSL